MTKEEFTSKVKDRRAPTNKEWSIIEYVYTWHPSIDTVRGKDQITTIYNTCGMTVIYDMLKRATAAQGLQEAYDRARIACNVAKENLDNLSTAEEVPLGETL